MPGNAHRKTAVNPDSPRGRDGTGRLREGQGGKVGNKRLDGGAQDAKETEGQELICKFIQLQPYFGKELR